MKKLLSVILVIIILTASIFSVFAYIPGDVNKDKAITADDARTVLRAAVGLETLTEEEFTNADIDKDGIITANDARMVLRAAVGLEILHSHEFNEWTVSKPATCTEKGELISVCSCGEESTAEIPMLPHSSADGNWLVSKIATCTGKGEIQSVCSCGKKLTAEIPMLPHSSSDGIWTVSKPSSCTEKGELQSECSCGEKLAVEFPMLPHSSVDGSWTVSKPSSCTEKGELQSECSCGEKLTSEIHMLHHNSADGIWTVTKTASCTEKGEKQTECLCGKKITIEFPELQHSFSADECSVCGTEKPENHTNIPRLDFTGNISGMKDKKDVREIDVTYTSEKLSFAGSAKLKVQGTSSLAYDKKNYTINFYEDSSLEEKMNVDVGWGAQNKYCLKANWIDKTHARNVVTANIAAEVQHKYGLFENTPHNGTIDGFPVEIYSNGEFLGIYTFNIPKDAWMFNMDEDNPDHLVFCGEGWHPANYFETVPDIYSWAVEVGEENDYSMGKLTELFNFIINSTDEEFISDFNEHLNFDSTINYYLLTEFAFLPDNIGKNMLLATYDGKVWYPTLYDLDTSWGTFWDGKSLFDYKNEKIPYEKSILWNKLQTLFADELSERYSELREDILTKEYILGKFNAFADTIPQQSVEREIEKWGTNIPGYDISQIEEYLDYIIPVLDAKYGYTASDKPSEDEPSTEESTTENTLEEETTTAEETTFAEETTLISETTMFADIQNILQ